jgi:hypothetical protein
MYVRRLPADVTVRADECGAAIRALRRVTVSARRGVGIDCFCGQTGGRERAASFDIDSHCCQFRDEPFVAFMLHRLRSLNLCRKA